MGIVATSPSRFKSKKSNLNGSEPCLASNDGFSIEANDAYSDASLEAKSTPIEFAISKGPLVHLNPTLAPLSTSSIEHIPSSTIWEDTQNIVPNKRLLISSETLVSHSSDPERSHS